MGFRYFREEYHRWLILSKLFWFMLAPIYNEILTFVSHLWWRLLSPGCSLYPNSKHLLHNTQGTHTAIAFLHVGRLERKQLREAVEDNIKTVIAPSCESVFLTDSLSLGKDCFLVFCWFNSFSMCIIKKRYSKKSKVYMSFLVLMKPEDEGTIPIILIKSPPTNYLSFLSQIAVKSN